ncbi:DUF2169 family type VI secretion system accessory protein [Halopseudomonas salegens]|nr:DUF2169 domain-containing protein [Halopseudomonas salegens]
MRQPPYVLESPVEAAALPEVRNHTHFPSQYFQMMDTSDKVFHVLVSRLTYDLSNLDEQKKPRLAREQQELVQSDMFYSKVNASSLVQESDFAPYKPRCDVLFAHATAYAPDGKQATRWPVGVKIGEWRKVMAVCGPRTIQPGVLGWKLNNPEPAIQVPIRYELAFGGTYQWPETLAEDEEPQIHARYEPNPIGCGLLHSLWLKKVRPQMLKAPQMEVFEQPFKDHWLERLDYPVMGLGAIGRWWQPRVSFAGTYDQNWKEHRWPRLPLDFDANYWNCAPQDQQIDYPEGGEEILLVGLTPGGGQFRACLPDRPPHALARLHAGPILARPMHLDTLIFDMHRMTLTCVHRMLIAADADVRVLEIRRREA